MSKVLLVDLGDISYSRMFAKILQKKMDVTIVTKYYSHIENGIHMFYKYSEKMKASRIRNIIRGLEYIIGYYKLLYMIKRKQFDIIHFQWALIPEIDIYFWKKIKKYSDKLVFTAHDVIPHTVTEKRIKLNKKLYSIPDKLIVHGEYCKNEIKEYYPQVIKRVYIQKHGCELESKKIEYNNYSKYTDFLKQIKNDEKIVIGFVGQINKYKGLDLLAQAWGKLKNKNKFVLLIAGKCANEYTEEFENICNKLISYNNIYIYNERFSDYEENILYSSIDVVLLPYVTASMSGVLFTAAKYKKTVMITQVGCLKEYIEPVKSEVFVCNPTIESLLESLNLIAKNKKEELQIRGKNLFHYINENFNWNDIIDDLIKDVYAK